MITLGIDPGGRRIGVALSDPLGVTARPLTVIEHASLAGDVERVVELAAAHKAERVVVGHPLNADGSVGPAARRAGRFANAIRRKSGMEVVLWDEHLTTAEAEQIQQNRGPSPRAARSRDSIDMIAAAVLLQDYLNAQRRA